MPPTDTSAALLLRRAETHDLPSVAEVYLAARDAAYPAMPRSVHPPGEVRDWVAGWDLDEDEVWLACAADGQVLGFAHLRDCWLDGLYVAPGARRAGVGSVLLDLVKARRPDGVELWVFESNEPARAFYRRQGLVEVERTDGSANEERQPDIRMAWRPGSAS